MKAKARMHSSIPHKCIRRVSIPRKLEIAQCPRPVTEEPCLSKLPVFSGLTLNYREHFVGLLSGLDGLM